MSERAPLARASTRCTIKMSQPRSLVESDLGKDNVMAAETDALVPAWALTAEPVSVPSVLAETGMTPARLTELRTVLAALAEAPVATLAALADAPVATLEAHPVPAALERTGGIALHAARPLAQQLSRPVAQTAKAAPAKINVAETGEVLYRMVVPAKVAAQVCKGLVAPITSKAVAGGV